MRLYPPVLTVAAAGAMVALDHWAPMARMVPHNPWGIGPALLGVALVLWAALSMRRRATTLHPHGQPTALVVTGPFRVSRNPIYLGFALMLAGLAASLGSSAPFAVLAVWVFAISHLFIQPEEARLAELFGAEYEAYTHKVRRWF